MNEVIDHLSDALDSLEKARNEADLGTRMMITEVIEELAELTERTKDINSDDAPESTTE